MPPAAIGRKGDSLEDLLTKAFKYFPSQRVIVVLDQVLPPGITANRVANSIKAIRGIHPEVLQEIFSQKLNCLVTNCLQSESDFALLYSKAKKWLSNENNKQDLVAHEWHLAGFEWPSIIYITRGCPPVYAREFHSDFEGFFVIGGSALQASEGGN